MTLDQGKRILYFTIILPLYLFYNKFHISLVMRPFHAFERQDSVEPAFRMPHKVLITLDASLSISAAE